MYITAVELHEGTAYLVTSKGDIWRVWMDHDGAPLIELLPAHDAKVLEFRRLADPDGRFQSS